MKPGIASLIVFTVVTVLVFWAAAGLDMPKEVYAFLSTTFLLVVWWTVWRGRRKLFRRIEEVSAEAAARNQELQERTARLEAELSQLRAAPPAMPATPVVAAPAAMAPTVATPATAAARPQVGLVASSAVFSSVVPPPPPPLSSPQQAAANLSFGQAGGAAREPGPSLFQRLRGLLKFEELLGTNWLAKIGAIILVLGIAFFLAWQLRDLGPAGKVTVGWVLGGALLAAGIFFERKERYRIVARAGVAAGWGIIFITAFAMNHFLPMRVLSEGWDLALMFVVAAGMVVHTLRYGSQVATGLAFLCAFAGIFTTVLPSKEVPPADVYSLTAALVLAMGVAAVAVSRQWFILEICAIVATFLNHFVWLIHIIQPMGKHHKPFAEFLPSAIILAGYWAVYRASYLVRRGQGHERISALAALLNTALLLAVLKYQSVHPEYAFWALLALGSIELILGQLPIARRHSMPHIVLTVIGACLLFTAIPFRVGLEAKGVSLLWLAMAEAFFLVGVLTKEQVFRRVGLFAFVPLGGQLMVMEAAVICGRRWDGADFKGEFGAGAICALVTLVLYANVHWVPRRWVDQFSDLVEQLATRDLSYFAGALGLTACWMAFPNLGTAVSWMGLACALAWLAYRFDFPPLPRQSLLLAAFAFLRVLEVNLAAASSYTYRVGGRPWSARLITTVAVVALCYLAAHWHRRAESSGLRWIEPYLTWVASTMFTLLLWYELASAGVALGWGAFAVVMLEAGIWRPSVNLRLQAYLAGVCMFLRLLFVNLNASSSTAQRISPRVYTIVPLALLFFYIYQRLDEQVDHLSSVERRVRAAPVFAWLGTTTVVLMLRFETPLDWVATAWAATVLAAMALAWRTGKRVFAHQALLLSLGVLFRGVLHNLYERSYFHPLSRFLSYMSTLSAVALLFAGLFFAFKLRRQPSGEKKNRLVRAGRMLDAHPEQVLFFAALALFTAFLGVEVQSGWLTLAWTLEAVGVFVIAMWIGERSYRLSAMGLLLLVIGKIFIFDFKHMSLPEKAITFTAVGALIIGVSIVYTRYREKVRQYL